MAMAGSGMQGADAWNSLHQGFGKRAWPTHWVLGFLPRGKSLLVPLNPSGESFGTSGLRKEIWEVGDQEIVP